MFSENKMFSSNELSVSLAVYHRHNKYCLILMYPLYILLARNTSFSLRYLLFLWNVWLGCLSCTNIQYYTCRQPSNICYIMPISCSNLIGLFASFIPETTNNIDNSNQNLTQGSISWPFLKIIASPRCTHRD